MRGPSPHEDAETGGALWRSCQRFCAIGRESLVFQWFCSVHRIAERKRERGEDKSTVCAKTDASRRACCLAGVEALSQQVG